MEELIARGIDKDVAVFQVAEEFGINPHQVKVSLNRSEVDAFIPKPIWDQLPVEEQECVESRVFAIFDDGNHEFEVDFYQNITNLIDGWPDPTITNSPGAIIFNPNGSVIHEPFSQ